MSNNRNFNCIIIFDKTTILETCETKKKRAALDRELNVKLIGVLHV